MKDSLDILSVYNESEKLDETPVEYVSHDSLNILRNDVICHHGVKGMKWGVRKEYETTGSSTSTTRNDSFVGRKKKVTQGDGFVGPINAKGVHKRGEALNQNVHKRSDGGILLGVGGEHSYYNSISSGMGQAPITTQLGQALYTAVEHEIRESEEYKNIKTLIEEFKKIEDNRGKQLGQGKIAAVEVLEKKANKLIKEINSNLNALDRKYYEKTKMINQTADHDYKPSKSIVDGLAYQLNSSIGIKLDKESGRVRKGWKYGQATP